MYSALTRAFFLYKLRGDPKSISLFRSIWLYRVIYREILHELDIGSGTTSRTINDARKQTPDIDQLRKLNLRLKDIGFSVLDATRGCKAIDRDVARAPLRLTRKS